MPGAIAIRRLLKMVRNASLDVRYGHVTGLVKRHSGSLAASGAHAAASTDYAALGWIFRGRIRPDDVLVDVGCGRGRILSWWLHQGYRNRLFGLELDEDLARQTRARFRKHPQVTIVSGDAPEILPAEGTLFYLYHPFTASVLRRFADRFAELFGESGAARIVYYNCEHVREFEEDPRFEVEKVPCGDLPWHVRWTTTPFLPLAIVTLRARGITRPPA